MKLVPTYYFRDERNVIFEDTINFYYLNLGIDYEFLLQEITSYIDWEKDEWVESFCQVRVPYETSSCK